MREKIIATITLTSIFTLFLYYKINSNDNNIAVSQIDVKSDLIDYDIDSNVSDQIIEEIVVKDGCSLSQSETDSYSFSDAFKYYRNCLGKGEVFSWNSNSYKTLLATETIINSEDENESMTINNKNQSADKEHLHLLNQMIGQNK
tara:strand:- start:768 stop:1202 length:435 start_codon:yes stop_codon:yes gene_type:complete